MIIKYKKLCKEAEAPAKATPGSAGSDVIATSMEVNLAQNCVVYGTGLSVALPTNTFIDLRARSSISKKEWVLANGAGVVDQDYRGEIKLVFRPTNPAIDIRDEHPYKVGDRVGQFVLVKCQVQEYTEVEDLDETKRGRGGFGSTGAAHYGTAKGMK